MRAQASPFSVGKRGKEVVMTHSLSCPEVALVAYSPHPFEEPLRLIHRLLPGTVQLVEGHNAVDAAPFEHLCGEGIFCAQV